MDHIAPPLPSSAPPPVLPVSAPLAPPLPAAPPSVAPLAPTEHIPFRSRSRFPVSLPPKPLDRAAPAEQIPFQSRSRLPLAQKETQPQPKPTAINSAAIPADSVAGVSLELTQQLPIPPLVSTSATAASTGTGSKGTALLQSLHQMQSEPVDVAVTAVGSVVAAASETPLGKAANDRALAKAAEATQNPLAVSVALSPSQTMELLVAAPSIRSESAFVVHLEQQEKQKVDAEAEDEDGQESDDGEFSEFMSYYETWQQFEIQNDCKIVKIHRLPNNTQCEHKTVLSFKPSTSSVSSSSSSSFTSSMGIGDVMICTCTDCNLEAAVHYENWTEERVNEENTTNVERYRMLLAEYNRVAHALQSAHNSPTQVSPRTIESAVLLASSSTLPQIPAALGLSSASHSVPLELHATGGVQ